MRRYEKFCLKTAKLAAYGVLIVPFFYTSRLFFPYTSTKTFLFRTLVELAFVFWVPLIIFFREWRREVNVFCFIACGLAFVRCGIVFFWPFFQKQFLVRP